MSNPQEITMTIDDPAAIDAAMDRALAERPEASALACVDAASGFVIASAARSEAALDAVTSGAAIAGALGVPPSLDGDDGGDVPEPARSMVATRRWVQVHERVPGRPSLYVVGVAHAGEEMARLASCVRDVSMLLGARG